MSDSITGIAGLRRAVGALSSRSGARRRRLAAAVAGIALLMSPGQATAETAPRLTPLEADALAHGTTPAVDPHLLVTGIEAEERYDRPASGVYLLDGRGHGHGRGMSQWGARAAASLGKAHRDILATYYPGTSLTSRSDRPLRVWLSVDDQVLELPAQTSLRVSNGASTAVLPTTLGTSTCRVTRWRARWVSGGSVLEGQACARWITRAVGGSRVTPGPLTFSTTSGLTRIVLGPGAGTHVREYRGTLSATRGADGNPRVVNSVAMESYLRSVVAWEMSPSWPSEALQAQAVAARTYAAWDAATPSAIYDTCDSTACQAYRGTGDYTFDGQRTRAYEWPTTDAAVSATTGEHLMHDGRLAFTQFSAANGGWSTPHTDPLRYSYLPEREDPWDGLLPNSGNTWTASVPVAAIEAKWPGIGSLQSLVVLDRLGTGPWDGRVRSVALRGSAGSAVVPGETFRAAMGLKSTWWRPTGA